MNKVKDILAKKPKAVFTVSSDATLYQALEIMADKNIGAILVTDKNGKLTGIFSERDFARKIIIKGRDGEKTTVGEIMTTQVLYVDPETTINDCMTLMTEKRSGTCRLWTRASWWASSQSVMSSRPIAPTRTALSRSRSSSSDSLSVISTRVPDC